jgi:hypothetical protein
MNTSQAGFKRHTIGVDLGDKRSHICVLDAKGQVGAECTIGLRRSRSRAGAGAGLTRLTLRSQGISPGIDGLVEGKNACRIGFVM